MKTKKIANLFLAITCLLFLVSCGSDDSAPATPKKPDYTEKLTEEDKRQRSLIMYSFIQEILPLRYSPAVRNMSIKNREYSENYSASYMRSLNGKQIDKAYTKAIKLVSRIAVKGVVNPIKEYYRLYYNPSHNSYEVFDVDKAGRETLIDDTPGVQVRPTCVRRIPNDYQCEIMLVQVDDPVHGIEYILFRLMENKYLHMDYSPEAQAYAILQSGDSEGQDLLEEYITIRGIDKLKRKGFFKGIYDLNRTLSDGILDGLNKISEVLTPRSK